MPRKLGQYLLTRLQQMEEVTEEESEFTGKHLLHKDSRASHD
jgi:hypothetical protein